MLRPIEDDAAVTADVDCGLLSIVRRQYLNEIQRYRSFVELGNIDGVGQFLSASCTISVMRVCETGDVFVSVYTDRRLATVSRNEVFDAIMSRKYCVDGRDLVVLWPQGKCCLFDRCT